MNVDASWAPYIGGIAVCMPWLVLLFWGGGFWRSTERLSDSVPALSAWPSVVAVVPARNEADAVGAAVESLLRQQYVGNFQIILVDDGSSDGTVEVAQAAAQMAGCPERLTTIAGRPLEPGWSGKLWAVSQGIEAAADLMPDAIYLLLTDADIVHDAGNLSRLVGRAEGDRRDLVSLMVLLRCQGFWEQWLIPAFVFFFQKLYPFPWVNRHDMGTAAAAGGCMLVRKTMLARIGGIQSVRSRLIDDCALAREIKASGGSLWLGLTTRVRSLRAYDQLTDVWDMVARSAFEQLGHSWLAVAGTVAGMGFLYIGPPAAVFLGALAGDVPLAAFGLLAWLLMVVAYAPTLRLYGLGAWRGVALPVVAALYAAMTFDSALRHQRGRGGAWKGRSYARPR